MLRNFLRFVFLSAGLAVMLQSVTSAHFRAARARVVADRGSSAAIRRRPARAAARTPTGESRATP